MKDHLRTEFKSQFEITKHLLNLTAKELELTVTEKSIFIHLTQYLGQHT